MLNNHSHVPLRRDTIRLATGIRMNYIAAGDPASHPIILLHGFSDSWFSYSRVLRSLAATTRVYAPDLRGHGDSDRPAHGYTMHDFAADILALMDALRIPSATVVGHSMGSLIAQQIALSEPERVARLVLVGASATPRTAELLDFQQVVNQLTDPVPEDFLREFQIGTAYQPLPEEFLNQVIVESSKLPAYVWKAAMAGMMNTNYAGRLAEIRVPSLLLWGDQDTIFSRADQELLAAGLQDATLTIYPQTGHALHWERPEAFVSDLAGFVAGPVLR